MLIRISNLYDSSTSTTNQRQRNEVYQTPRFRAPDAYPYRHARVAASRCLRQNDGNRKSLSNIQDLPLPTAFDGEPAVGNAVQRRKAPVSKRSSTLRPTALVVALGRQMLAS